MTYALRVHTLLLLVALVAPFVIVGALVTGLILVIGKEAARK